MNDGDSKRGRASTPHQLCYFMPVDPVGDCFGDLPGQAQANQLGNAPGVHAASFWI
ncbi:MAG TPA: hypothetical protein VMA73_31695 [Streptosporangiaceae bacterium]|nr:hypothetical protein [Streptosporangiaceae bacterium]